MPRQGALGAARRAHALRVALQRLAVCAAWDESAATEWWRELRARGVLRAAATASIGATTIEVDVTSRTVG